jgi:hypothetical protein
MKVKEVDCFDTHSHSSGESPPQTLSPTKQQKPSLSKQKSSKKVIISEVASNRIYRGVSGGLKTFDKRLSLTFTQRHLTAKPEASRPSTKLHADCDS